MPRSAPGAALRALLLALALASCGGAPGRPALAPAVARHHHAYDLSPRVDHGEPILFGQRGISPTFSAEGSFHGADLDAVAARLRAGALAAREVVVHFIWVDGRKVAINNRSLAVLAKAGLAPVRVEDVSGRLPPAGDDSLERVLARLDEMGGRPARSIALRAWHAHDAPVREVITIVAPPPAPAPVPARAPAPVPAPTPP